MADVVDWANVRVREIPQPGLQRLLGHNSSRHIGCPLEWFKRVYPVVWGKQQLAVALYLYRLRTVRQSRTVIVSNERLLTELGINRYAKYRALRRLTQAGIITVKRCGKGATLQVTFCEGRGGKGKG